jgi:hypothetical protein
MNSIALPVYSLDQSKPSPQTVAVSKLAGSANASGKSAGFDSLRALYAGSINARALIRLTANCL